jgi:hypothetical protein
VCDLQVFQQNPVCGKCIIVGYGEVLLYINTCVKNPKIKNTEGCWCSGITSRSEWQFVCLLQVVRPVRSSHFLQCRNYTLALRRPRPVKPICHTQSRIPLQVYTDTCQPAVMNSLCGAVLVDRAGLSAVLDPSLWYIGWRLCHFGEHSADSRSLIVRIIFSLECETWRPISEVTYYWLYDRRLIPDGGRHFATRRYVRRGFVVGTEHQTTWCYFRGPNCDWDYNLIPCLPSKCGQL